MFYNAKGGNVKLGETDMNYVVFGHGKKPFVILPGLSDGLKTVHKQEKVLAMYYKQFAKNFRVYVFSRKNKLEKGYSSRDMARDQKIAMEKLGIYNAYIMGVSQGGMIAQYLAIDYPEIVEKLIIAVSVSRQTETLQKVVERWIEMASSNDYKNLVIDTVEKTFTEKRLKRYRLMYPIISRIGKPKDFDRFLIQAHACINHNAYNELDKIKCPTLVIGGDSDEVVGKTTSEEMAEKIKESKLVIYEGLGHGAYEESEDFNHQIMNFLT
ncbi:alpha/beta hydrolase [Alkaliphilus pronyensis]|uniref:Alpha/beta hydrolase n=1 Tax=Alkaliphilus pronyensis TaxID=1482732 RepID=A0A6I0F7C9_9FIRM|nr:alpha/beta hydrolase [Alkaliphilus pronyensis]KAB3538540.1 alpha/beta hydrolase [Alkaliphilus pronyensis]